MKLRFKLRAPYSQDQIKQQQEIIRALMDDRDRLASSESEKDGEYARATDAIEAAQYVLVFMAEELRVWHERHK